MISGLGTGGCHGPHGPTARVGWICDGSPSPPPPETTHMCPGARIAIDAAVDELAELLSDLTSASASGPIVTELALLVALQTEGLPEALQDAVASALGDATVISLARVKDLLVTAGVGLAAAMRIAGRLVRCARKLSSCDLLYLPRQSDSSMSWHRASCLPRDLPRHGLPVLPRLFCLCRELRGHNPVLWPCRRLHLPLVQPLMHTQM